MTIRFDTIIGIDQTGAAVRGGLGARPLPCAILRGADSRRWRVSVLDARASRPLRLKALGRSSVRGLLGDEESRDQQLALMLDCVFGFPAALGDGASLQELLAAASTFELSGARYGRPVSEAFFKRYYDADAKRGEAWPTRLCERLAGANSVFRTRPYQKNVQTGTYRFWRELGQSLATEGAWLGVWPFDVGTPTKTKPAPTPAPEAWAFEAFPTLLWRDLLGLRTRDRSQLRAACERAAHGKARLLVDSWAAIESDAEIADAFVLALGGALLQHDDRLWEPAAGLMAQPWLRTEGWIAGLARTDLKALPGR